MRSCSHTMPRLHAIIYGQSCDEQLFCVKQDALYFFVYCCRALLKPWHMLPLLKGQSYCEVNVIHTRYTARSSSGYFPVTAQRQHLGRRHAQRSPGKGAHQRAAKETGVAASHKTETEVSATESMQRSLTPTKASTTRQTDEQGLDGSSHQDASKATGPVKHRDTALRSIDRVGENFVFNS